MSYRMMATVGVAALAVSSSAFAGQLYFQGFETDTTGWSNGSGSYGTISRVSTGNNSISSSQGGYHAIVTGGNTNGGTPSAPYTFFQQPVTSWGGGYTARVDVYIDTGWANVTGFDYSVSMLNGTGGFLRDFIFNVAKDESTASLLLKASNNSSWQSASPAQQKIEDGDHLVISSSGWYTLEHVFRDDNGTLAADLSVYNASGTSIFSQTLSNAGDVISNVGGVNYGWFTFENTGGLAIDNVSLSVVPTPSVALGTIILGSGLGLRRRR